MIQLIPVGSGGGGGGGNVTELLTPGTMGQTFQDVLSGSYNVPSGSYRVTVWNTGLVNITVNTQSLAPGEKWEVQAFENRSTTKIDFCPDVAIVVPAGGAAQYQVLTPS